jgi:hypothetical protein
MGAGDPPRAAAEPVASLEAAKLYLDRLNVLGTKQARTSCFDTMAADVPKLRELCCKDDSAQRNTDARERAPRGRRAHSAAPAAAGSAFGAAALGSAAPSTFAPTR